MINHLPSQTTGAIDHSSFRVGPIKHAANEPPSPAPPEQVIANHTAEMPSRALRANYTFQSIRTGLPLLLADQLATAIGFTIASYLAHLSQGNALSGRILMQAPVWMFLQFLMMSVYHLYPGAGIGPVAELRGIVRSTFYAMLCLAGMNVVLGQLPQIELLAFVLAAAFISALVTTSRCGVRRILSRTRWWGIRILLIGLRDDCMESFEQLSRRRSSGFVPAGYTCDLAKVDPFESQDQRLLGADSDAVDLAGLHSAPVAGLVSPEANSPRTDRLMFEFPCVVWIGIAAAARKDLDTTGLPQVFTSRLRTPFLRFLPRACKRAVDLAICIPCMIILAVPMGIIALAIKYYSPGPVIYGSRRIGQHGRQFKMWKFRSMVPGADQILQEKLQADPEARREWERDAKLKSDPRIIPGIGHLIRRWSLDELPQLWNVLVGEMSLVGPRPVPPDEIVRYQDHYYEYTQMWPGITGLWQVSGRNDTTFDTRVFLVHHYARNWSPWLDFWVLLNTPAVIVSKSGAY